MATAGSKEARQLEKVKRTFEKIYQNNEADASAETEYSIGGINAIKQMKDSKYKSDALKNYEKALKLKKDGVNNEEIRQQTKWFQDKYGKWKFEFDDSSIKLIKNINKNSTYKLKDIISHDYLFELYPELADYNISFKNKQNGATTYYGEKEIEINNSLLSDRKQLKGTLLHEIQHVIQHVEGFNTGTNTILGRRRYANRLGEIEVSDTKQRYMNDMSKEDRMHIAPESSKSNPTHPQREQILSKMNKIEKSLNSLYDIFRGESDEIIETSNNENTKILHGRNRPVGSTGDKSQKFAKQGRIEEGLENSSSFNNKQEINKEIKRLNSLIYIATIN